MKGRPCLFLRRLVLVSAVLWWSFLGQTRGLAPDDPRCPVTCQTSASCCDATESVCHSSSTLKKYTSCGTDDLSCCAALTNTSIALIVSGTLVGAAVFLLVPLLVCCLCFTCRNRRATRRFMRGGAAASPSHFPRGSSSPSINGSVGRYRPLNLGGVVAMDAVKDSTADYSHSYMPLEPQNVDIGGMESNSNFQV
ncbi:hypothetical protein QOT17_010553 [Balamuthia mandrillaris]